MYFIVMDDYCYGIIMLFFKVFWMFCQLMCALLGNLDESITDIVKCD